MGLLKILMSIFNVIFFLVGGSLLGVGIWLLVDDYVFDYLVVTGNQLYWEIALYTMMSAGGVILLVGVLGCLGACTENKPLLISYEIFVILAVIAEVVAITFVGIFYADMDSLGETMLRDVKYNYRGENSYDSLSVAWNSMQIQWDCCGSYSYKDYRGSYFQQNAPSGISVPWTCCVMKYDVSPKYATKNDVLNHTLCQLEARTSDPYPYRYLNSAGCYYDMEEVVDLAAPITLGVLSGFVLIQLIGFGMSCAMMMKKGHHVGAI